MRSAVPRCSPAAVEAAEERAAELAIDVPQVLAITILTSIGAEDLNELGLQGGPGENAIRLGALARDARCSGVVCSVAEVARGSKGFSAQEFAPCVRAFARRKRARRPEAHRDAA